MTVHAAVFGQTKRLPDSNQALPDWKIFNLNGTIMDGKQYKDSWF